MVINFSQTVYVTTTSHGVHKSWYCLLRHVISLFLKGYPQVIEVLGCEIKTFDSADPTGSPWDSGLEKVQVTPFVVPQPPAVIS